MTSGTTWRPTDAELAAAVARRIVERIPDPERKLTPDEARDLLVPAGEMNGHICGLLGFDKDTTATALISALTERWPEIRKLLS